MIGASPRYAGPFLGNDLATAFPFNFKVFSAADLAVYRTLADGTVAKLVLATHYSVGLNANQESNPGGTVTYPLAGAPLPAGEKLTIVCELPYQQQTDLPDGGLYRAAAVEGMGDYQNVLIQQLLELIGRSIRVPPGYTGTTLLATDPAAHPGAAIIVDEDGNFGYSDEGNGVFALLNGGNEFTGAQTVRFHTLPFEAVVTPPAGVSNHFRLAMTGNCQIANPTGLRDGGIYNFWFKQDATANRQITAWGSKFKWSLGAPPLLSSYPNAIDIVVCQYSEVDDVLACTHTEEIR